jgi:hypothetical protein
MIVTVRGLLDHGGYLADPEFIAWLGQRPEEMRLHLDAFWSRFISGWQLGGPEGMATAVEGYMNEIGATEGLREIMQEDDARRLAVSRTKDKRRAMLETCGSAGKGMRKGCTFPVIES